MPIDRMQETSIAWNISNVAGILSDDAKEFELSMTDEDRANMLGSMRIMVRHIKEAMNEMEETL